MRVTDSITIDESELDEDFVRSSGPGGQNVNKLATAVQLRFDARRSKSLPNDVAIRLMRLAGSRLTKDGNRADARDRLIAMIREAAVAPVKRRPTKPSKAARQKRLDSKKRRGNIKGIRQSKPSFE
jgi:ribosome-associated protein